MRPEDQTPVPSPCINVCDMAPDTGLCRGCMRTIDEIVAWGSASDEAKRAVWAERPLKEPIPGIVGRVGAERTPMAVIRKRARCWLPPSSVTVQLRAASSYRALATRLLPVVRDGESAEALDASTKGLVARYRELKPEAPQGD